MELNQQRGPCGAEEKWTAPGTNRPWGTVGAVLSIYCISQRGQAREAEGKDRDSVLAIWQDIWDAGERDVREVVLVKKNKTAKERQKPSHERSYGPRLRSLDRVLWACAPGPVEGPFEGLRPGGRESSKERAFSSGIRLL